MRSLLLCLSRTDTEAFCQTELFVFANCKFERVRRSPTRALFNRSNSKKQDQTLRRSIANWWKKEAPNMSSAEAGRRVEQIREDMDEIKHRLAFVQAADPHEAKMKVRTQLQGEIEDMQSWLSILKKFHPSV